MLDASFGHEKSPAEPDKTHPHRLHPVQPRYDDLAGFSEPRLKTFVLWDYIGISRKKQAENILSSGV